MDPGLQNPAIRMLGDQRLKVSDPFLNGVVICPAWFGSQTPAKIAHIMPGTIGSNDGSGEGVEWQPLNRANISDDILANTFRKRLLSHRVVERLPERTDAVVESTFTIRIV